MATDEKPSARKPANRRTGRARGWSGQKGGAHTIPWRDDQVIVDRVEVGQKPYREKKTDRECLDYVNRWLAQAYPKEAPISLTTLKDDRRRALELRREAVVNAVAEHAADMDHLIAEAWAAYQDLDDRSLNRSALLNVVVRAVELKAKLDGSLRKDTTALVNVEGDVVQKVVHLVPSEEELRKAVGVLGAHMPGFRERVMTTVEAPARIAPPTEDVEEFQP